MLKRSGFEIKDIITAIIAFAALTTSITSLWAGYLRKARLRLTLPDGSLWVTAKTYAYMYEPILPFQTLARDQGC